MNFRQIADDSEHNVAEWVKRISAHRGIADLDRATTIELIDSMVAEKGDGGMDISIRYRFISDYLQKGAEGIAQATPSGC